MANERKLITFLYDKGIRTVQSSLQLFDFNFNICMSHNTFIHT